MSQTRYLLGGAVLAGAGYYVYQTRLEQSKITTQQDSLKNKLPGFGSSSTGTSEGPGQYTGRKLDEITIDTRDKLDDLKTNANKQLDKGFSQAESEKARLANWTNEKINNAQEKLDQVESKSQEKASIFSKDAHKDDPKGLNKLGKDIEKEAEAAKSSVFGSLSNAKDSIIGTKDDVEHQIKSKSQDLQSGAQDQLNKAESKANGWFGKAQDETNKAVDSTKANLEQGKKSFWSGWFGAKDETKESIDFAYQEAQQLYDDAEKRYKETKKSWLSWNNKDDTKEKLHKDAELELKKAQDNLQKAQDKVSHWQNKAKETLDQGVDKLNKQDLNLQKSNGFYDWLRGGDSKSTGRGINDETLAKRTQQGLKGWGETAEEFSKEQLNEVSSNKSSKSWGFGNWFGGKSNQSKDEEIAQRAQKGLRGWGESAEQFSKDEFDDVKHQADQKKAELDSKLKEWSAWTNKKYADSKEGAEEFYKDAQSNFNKAEEELKKNSSGWLSWSSKQAKDLEAETKKHFEESEKKLTEASENLKNWTNQTSRDAGVKFWSSADGALHQAQNGVDKANEGIQSGINDVRSLVQEKK
ncbi:Myosin heavy chain, skeletal muscle, adult [Wickerhamomyces ciferrii]|uniref:Myosin heavy chain, skeletal muscle, adult n=1 Tax=Wickerhamomyces ciferrii (strain ATCC 14091 / BCRC 22168 / CBS 111 / JCM 3599 / NBRC 0793 / NRRL Y-1031 F-60-10) TaxID=1206466 RepID=K0KVL0_WICCF|nr:Myosin heavy chain, skeletal muscle, adult [Wickerhamomyces ciferrii]CCH45178.1 Myosin heavy chain, skeletal muscle, adult [Wickerhamomyces ciferrii]